jgi:hypothetical protein
MNPYRLHGQGVRFLCLLYSIIGYKNIKDIKVTPTAFIMFLKSEEVWTITLQKQKIKKEKT